MAQIPRRHYYIGRSGTGKSTKAVLDILEMLPQYMHYQADGTPRYNIVVMCPTLPQQVKMGEERPYFYLWPFLHPSNVFIQATDTSLKGIIQRVKKNQEREERTLVVIDDISGTGLLGKKSNSDNYFNQFITDRKSVV